MANKILIVDDNADFRSELKDFLEGYDVIEAPNGEEALKILRRANEIGLVLLDVMMPGVNGIDVLSAIKKEDPDLSTVIMTGRSSKEIAIEALKERADDYMEKPPKPSEVLETVERLLGKKRGEGNISELSLKEKIEKVKQFIVRNKFKKITLESAAEAVCLSPKYLSRIFRDYEKKGFTDYKLAVKISAARDLLKKANYNVDQISYKLGYENTESFIRQFKKITGRTPTEYRNKFRKDRAKRRR